MLLTILGALSMVLGVVILICSILEIVAAFQNGDGPLMGILSIVFCGIGSFIIGWINHSKWGITKLMMTWSICIVLFIVVQLAVVGFAASTIDFKQLQEGGMMNGIPMPINEPMPQP